MDGEGEGVTLDEAAAVLGDARVVQAVRVASRDARIRMAYWLARGEGQTVEGAAWKVGATFGLSSDTVLGIVYRKYRHRKGNGEAGATDGG